MHIKELSHLSDEVVTQIRELEAICHAHDGLTRNVFLDTSMNFDQNMKTTFLLYDEERLVSFLSIFSPRSDEAEITAYTLPEFRLRGYCTVLLERAIAELKRYHVPSLLFVTESQSTSGRAAVEAFDAYHDFTEYVLNYGNTNNAAIQSFPYRLTLTTATFADLETLIKISQEVFGDSYENAKSLMVRTLESERKLQYIVTLEGQPVGIGAVSKGNIQASIYGLGILPEFQGKGFGKELLFLLIKDLNEKNYTQIILEVNSQNAKAYQLYTQNGFAIETAFDYYRKRVD